MIRYLLDTNIVSYFVKGSPRGICTGSYQTHSGYVLNKKGAL